MIKGINGLIDAFVEPITITADYVKRISNGDIPEKIETVYYGDFTVELEKLPGRYGIANESLSNLRINILRVSDEQMRILSAAAEGNLHIRGEYEKFTGSFKELVNTVNKAIDAFSKPIMEIDRALGEMANGNLDICVKNSYSRDYASIIKALNSSIQTINQALTDINVSANEVASASNQVSDSSQSLSQASAEQASAVEEITASLAEIVNRIATSCSEQASAVAQINDAVQQIARVTQINSATSEETASSSEEMSSQAENLKQRVAQFKLKRKNFNGIFLDNIEEKNIMDRGYTIDDKQFIQSSNLNGNVSLNLGDIDFGKY